MIEFRDVLVCYAPEDRYPVNALEGVNLKIHDGEWVFLVGPSGAGKSTLMKLLYAGTQATKGSILVNGHEVTQMTPREIPTLRRELGIIFQDFQLLPQKTVWENVAFALQVIGAPQKQLVRDVPVALETVGLHNKMQSKPHQLSGGEQQRVAIARAIVNNPKLLIADEPTGNLDPQTGSEIVNVLQRINERGTTIVMATHDRNVVDSMKRRVIRLADGRIVSDELGGEYHPEDGVLQQPRVAAPVVSYSKTVTPVSSPKTPDLPAAPTPIEPTTVEPVVVTPVREEIPAPRNGAPQNGSNGSSSHGRRERTIERAQTMVQSVHPEPEVVAPEPRVDDVPTPPREAPPREAPPTRTWAEESLIDKQRKNHAPLGSPENPLVQFDRTPNDKRKNRE